MKMFSLIVKNMFRNLVRSSLTAMGTMVLVFLVTGVWSVLTFIENATSEKNSNFKAIVTERWQIPSQMPFSYAASLAEGAARNPGDIKPTDSMTWQFYGGTIDPANRTIDNTLFAFSLEPIKLRTMMEELDNLPPSKAAPLDAAIAKMNENRQGLILGKGRMAALKKRIGDRITLYGLNYRDINLELEIVGEFPEGRYDNSAAIHRDYLLASLDEFEQKNGRKHPLAEKTLNLVWLRMPDRASFNKVAEQIMASPNYANPSVKIEMASSAVSTFMESYRDMLWGMKYLLAPAILLTLSLVISNAISISVRERRTELAVMKVLGFRPYQLLLLVLGEALLLGVVSGVVSAGLTYWLVNYKLGGLKLPIAFFGVFYIPDAALWWGLAVGTFTALAGSFLPAWSARTVRVAEVFAKVA